MNTAPRTQDIAVLLGQHEAALRRLRLKSLALFGSAAREAYGPESDLDLLYEFEEGAATLDRLIELQAFLEEVLAHKVDLVSRKYLSPILRRYIEGDVVPVYNAVAPS